MKVFIALLGCGLIGLAMSGVVFANQPEGKFEDHKAKMLEGIEKRLKSLTEHKTCVSGAKDHAGLKQCHDKMKDAREDMREGHLMERKKRIDKKVEDLNKQ